MSSEQMEYSDRETNGDSHRHDLIIHQQESSSAGGIRQTPIKNEVLVTRRNRFEIPASKQRQRVPLKAIQAVADWIVLHFDPDQIILCGSHAYGSPQPWSDVDLLVVMESEKHPVEASQEILQALPPFRFGLDILVRSAETIQRRIEWGDPFLKEITERGKILSARTDR